MKLSDLPEFDDHELVSVANDNKTGLRSIIAIHNTNLGPATGGTRYLHYSSEEEAIRDALKLSRAMTYKCALAGVPFGGGKGVIIGNHNARRKRDVLIEYAKRVDLFKGTFSTGEDVGINERDVSLMALHSRFINGRPSIGGDLSPWAAKGVLYSMGASLGAVFQNSEIGGKSFAIKGIGKVGSLVCEFIYKMGGRVMIADIDSKKIQWAKKKFPNVEVVKPHEIHRQRVDVYLPCALGNEFNKKTIPQLRCKIICGAANNQLASSEDGVRLHSWGILYIPDYLANAGGLINAVAELRKGGYHRRWVKKKVKAIRGTTKKVIELSKRLNKPTSELADRLAEKIFNKRR